MFFLCGAFKAAAGAGSRWKVLASVEQGRKGKEWNVSKTGVTVYEKGEQGKASLCLSSEGAKCANPGKGT